MTKTNLYHTLQNSTQFLSDSWKEQYADFLIEEHLVRLAKNLERYHLGVPDQHPLPYFEEEITPSLSEAFQYFKMIVADNNATPKDWAKTIEGTPFEYLLILIGQRWTATTIKSEEGIPPKTETLLQSCFEAFNNQICIATRAWEKHIGRSDDHFWGTMKGNPTQKEAKIRERITHMIANKTWWNIFYHYKHELVYEIRVPSGQGIRWNASGTKLIGFLEPFL